MARVAIFLVALVFVRVDSRGKYRGLEFLEPCSRSVPRNDLEKCLTKSADSLTKNLRRGLPVLGYTEVEPIILDELNIRLGNGPDGYKAQFTGVTARGVSNLKVTRVDAVLHEDEVQVRVWLSIPKIQATAKYSSSGTLIFVQASGSGDYWGKYNNVEAKVFIRAKPYVRNDNGTPNKYLKLQELKMDFRVQNLTMGVNNPDNSKNLLHTILNTFINAQGQELLKEMKPDLQKKLIQVLTAFVEKIFAKIPYDAWITD